MAEYLGMVLGSLVQLRHLEFNVSDNNILSAGVYHVFPKLPVGFLTKLITLRLDFSENHIGTKGGEYLFDALAVMEYLSIVELNLSYNPLYIQGVKNLCGIFEFLGRLTVLNLNLENTRLDSLLSEDLQKKLDLSLGLNRTIVSDLKERLNFSLPKTTKRLTLKLGYNGVDGGRESAPAEEKEWINIKPAAKTLSVGARKTKLSASAIGEFVR